jgi:hypothetical protein
MHGAFGTVIWVVAIGAFVVAVIALLVSRRTWEDFGKDGLLLDSEAGRGQGEGGAMGGGAGGAMGAGSGGAMGGGSSAAAGDGSRNAMRERDEEIRQMLDARNARRARRGEAPLDVEEELGRLTAPAIDPELRREIRDLVEARNYRRTRAGKPPLDVEAEVAREIARLGELR